jgi:phosphatidylserine decarboxylase
MKIHKEGKKFLIMLLIALIVTNNVIYLVSSSIILVSITSVISLSFLLFFTYFFRISDRTFIADDDYIVAPADGTIVVIEPTEENGLLHEKRIQVSIFMSVFNMHANWYPIAGKILHVSHQNGRYMAAYLPKSSTENERSTILIEAKNKQTILVRQIAGALARRIITYAKEGNE